MAARRHATIFHVAASLSILLLAYEPSLVYASVAFFTQGQAYLVLSTSGSVVTGHSPSDEGSTLFDLQRDPRQIKLELQSMAVLDESQDLVEQQAFNGRFHFSDTSPSEGEGTRLWSSVGPSETGKIWFQAHITRELADTLYGRKLGDGSVKVDILLEPGQENVFEDSNSIQMALRIVGTQPTALSEEPFPDQPLWLPNKYVVDGLESPVDGSTWMQQQDATLITLNLPLQGLKDVLKWSCVITLPPLPAQKATPSASTTTANSPSKDVTSQTLATSRVKVSHGAVGEGEPGESDNDKMSVQESEVKITAGGQGHSCRVLNLWVLLCVLVFLALLF